MISDLHNNPELRASLRKKWDDNALQPAWNSRKRQSGQRNISTVRTSEVEITGVGSPSFLPVDGPL
jgi:hypothetical protein